MRHITTQQEALATHLVNQNIVKQCVKSFTAKTFTQDGLIAYLLSNRIVIELSEAVLYRR